MKKINYNANDHVAELEYILVHKNVSQMVSTTTELLIVEALNSLAAINKTTTGLFKIDGDFAIRLIDITGLSSKAKLTVVLKKMAAKGLIELAIGNADGYEVAGGRTVFARSIVGDNRSGLFYKIAFIKKLPQEPCETKNKATYDTRMAKYKRDSMVYGLNGIRLCAYSAIYSVSVGINQKSNNKKGAEKVYDRMKGIAELEHWLPEGRDAISRAVSYLEEVNLIWINKVAISSCRYQYNITAAPISSFTTANLEKNGKLEAVNKAIASNVAGKVQPKRLKTIQSHINKTVENINKAVEKLTAESKPYGKSADNTYFDLEEAILGNDSSTKLAKDLGNLVTTDKNITKKRIAKFNETYKTTAGGILGALLFGKTVESFWKVENIDNYNSVRKEKLKSIIWALYENLDADELETFKKDISNINHDNGTVFSVIGWLHGETNYNIA